MDSKKEINSVCIRCGKTRVLLKTWRDRGETKKGSVILHEQMVCPDKECQKIVDEKFQKMRDLREAAENRKRDIILAKANKAQSTK